MTETAEPVRKRLATPPDAQRFVLGCVYRPDELDGHDEHVKAAELEKIAHEYVRKHRRIGFFHADGTEGHMDLVESYIHRGPDWHTTDISGNETVIKQGDWVMGGIADERGFDAILNEAADGWSMQGEMPRRISEVRRRHAD